MTGKRVWLWVVLWVVWPACALAALSPQDVTSPRPQSWVRDDAGLLAAEDEQNIDAMIEFARRTRAVEMAVVTVADAGTEATAQFALDLFNYWGIGDPQRHDGVLVFLAREQRAAEIVFGQGIPTSVGNAISQRVMDNVLIPRLKQGDFAGGLQATVETLLHELQGIEPPSLEQESGAASATMPLDPVPVRVVGPVRPEPAQPAPRTERSPWDRAADEPATWIGGGLFGLLAAFALRWWWRVRGRRCPRCHAAMQRLSEQADDAHLQPAQRLEEQLGSVDYDVWACTACSFVDTKRYGAWFTRFARCAKCHTVALEREQTTITAATYDHGGRVRIDEHCKHCGHRHSFERSTPRKTRSTSGGSGRSGGRSGGFSGGRSSGGGASGRW